MQLRNISIVLLALLLAAIAMVPMVSAAEPKVPATPSVDENIGLNAPEHYIPPEYFKDGQPAVPLPESEMMNLVLLEKVYRLRDLRKSVPVQKDQDGR